ncbi:hypothetical protein QOZ80_1BG0097490 [Eleusine coracana subsp. coracana]|nr:hypothetical protein QOZ80_1BG0097490 [Eleusine coracana subsp. coracana]
MAPRGAAALLVVAMAVALVVTASAAKEVNNKGRLSLDFYRRSCPQAESVVRRFVAEAVRQDVGLLHDCFGAAGRVRHRPRRAAGPAQPDAPAHGLQGRQRPPRAPGPGLRRGHRRLLRRHPRARGPQVGRPTECLWAAATARPSPPTAHVPELLEVLSKKINLDMTDLVALSGGHTIGLAHCSSFEDPTLIDTFARRLKKPPNMPGQPQHLRQQLPRQQGRTLHQPQNQEHRHQIRSKPKGVLPPVHRLHGQDGADQRAHRIPRTDPQKLLRAQQPQQQPAAAALVPPRRTPRPLLASLMYFYSSTSYWLPWF